MPPNLYKKNNKKRKYRKRLYGKKPPYQIGKSLPLICPDKMQIKLRYHEDVTATSIAGAFAEHSYSANSLFDPRQSLGGEQPPGFDEWSAFYNRYRVLSSTIKVELIPLTNTLTSMVDCVILPSRSNPSLLTTFDAIRTNTFAKHAICTNLDAGDIKTVANYVNIGKFMGEDIRTQNIFSALISSDPNTQVFWQIFTTAADGASEHTIRLRITISYWGEMFDRKELNES